MDIFAASERLMGMDDRVWARHANPWSVYTRFSCLPLIVLAIWSRDWIGWWCLLPVALALVWTWLNPRLFSPPATMDGWAAHAVLGERVFLARAKQPIPAEHQRMAIRLTWVSAAGAVVLIYGLAALEVWPTVTGLIVTIGGKLWFCDRMAWLYRESADRAEGTSP
ncbi:MAG: DUF6653 family protein [Pseudomonadota bacterium]